MSEVAEGRRGPRRDAGESVAGRDIHQRHHMLHGEFELSDPDVRRRELKHELAAAVRRLVEDTALVDATECDEHDLAELVGEVRRMAARFEGLDSHRRHGGLNMAPGWESALTERSPISGRSNPVAAPLELWSDGEVTYGRASYGGQYEGPPGNMHGGVVAGAFDELLGVAQSASGQAGFTGTLTIKMYKPSPLYSTIDYKGWVERVEGRKIFAKGTSSCNGELLCEAEGVFISPRDRTHPAGYGEPRAVPEPEEGEPESEPESG